MLCIGFAQVTFRTQEEAEDAMEIGGREIEVRRVFITRRAVTLPVMYKFVKHFIYMVMC